MSMKIGVLMGGDSKERIISISTGNQVLKALQKLGHNAENKCSKISYM